MFMSGGLSLFTSFAGEIWSRRADSNRFPAPATSVLLALSVRPNGLLAELGPPLSNASPEATLNGCWLSHLLTGVGRDTERPYYSLGTHDFQLLSLILGQ